MYFLFTLGGCDVNFIKWSRSRHAKNHQINILTDKVFSSNLSDAIAFIN